MWVINRWLRVRIEFPFGNFATSRSSSRSQQFRCLCHDQTSLSLLYFVLTAWGDQGVMGLEVHPQQHFWRKTFWFGHCCCCYGGYCTVFANPGAVIWSSTSEIKYWGTTGGNIWRYWQEIFGIFSLENLIENCISPLGESRRDGKQSSDYGKCLTQHFPWSQSSQTRRL